MPDDEPISSSVFQHLMQHAKQAKKKRPNCSSPKKDQSGFFPCPAGCGNHVSERDVNVHLDKWCTVMGGAGGSSASKDTSCTNHDSKNTSADGTINEDGQVKHPLANNSLKEVANKHQYSSSNSTPLSTKRAKISSSNKNNNHQNAFSHMMKQSVKVFGNDSESTAKHKFHLHHDQNGRITTTWITNQTDASLQMDSVVWSCIVTVKKINTIEMDPGKRREITLVSSTEEQQQKVVPQQDATTLELEVSSSIPFQQNQQTSLDNNHKLNFVQQHSRLSVAQLKSILQKSIRRRAPLPSVRVAMELADKSFSDLIRRLPIIILEDSFLHDDFDLLVWLMVAESKGYVPPTSLMIRVFQIVFEMASCSKRDECSVESNKLDGLHPLTSFSLTTPQLFPKAPSNQTFSINKCETLIRAMLLRAQYGGMAYDVNMLHSYSSLWLKRYQSSELLPSETVSSLPKLKIVGGGEKEIYMQNMPAILHESSREKSKQLITCETIAPGRLAKLTEGDICYAGIDFHCSPVVESLLSLEHVYSSLCEMLSSTNRDWIASQVKQCIWKFSSGVNRRRTLIEHIIEKSQEEEKLKKVWDEVLRSPFDEFTKKFVRQRLAW